MKKIVLFIIGLMVLFSCQKQEEAGFIVQVSLAGWHSPEPVRHIQLVGLSKLRAECENQEANCA